MPEPHAEDDTDRAVRRPRRAVGVGLAALAVVALIAVAGWFGFQRWEKARATEQQAQRAGELLAKLGRENKPLTDGEFAAALALCGAADPETRATALAAVAADAAYHNPARRGWAVPMAASLTTDPEAAVRTQAVRALGTLRAREHIDLIRAALGSADPRERAAAERALPSHDDESARCGADSFTEFHYLPVGRTCFARNPRISPAIRSPSSSRAK
jgi:type II secretory pathway pseudopilin PulG